MTSILGYKLVGKHDTKQVEIQFHDEKQSKQRRTIENKFYFTSFISNQIKAKTFNILEVMMSLQHEESMA